VEGKYRTPPPPGKFQNTFNKNAIKPEIGENLKALTHLGILAKASSTPSPGFSTDVYLWTKNNPICPQLGITRCIQIFSHNMISFEF
jgi:hypothetical protein